MRSWPMFDIDSSQGCVDVEQLIADVIMPVFGIDSLQACVCVDIDS